MSPGKPVDVASKAFPDGMYPDGHLRWIKPSSAPELACTPLWDLASELLNRIQRGEGFESTDSSAWLGSALLHALARNLDVHNHRFSRQRHKDLFSIFHTHVSPRPRIEDAVYVDLGCGSMNPFGMLFVFLALGARRGYAVDLDELQQPERAVEALAELAGLLLVDPGSVLDAYPITREQILRNLHGFDLAKLRSGDTAGIPAARLQFKRESLFEMSIADGEADLVFSNAFLEHIPQAARGIAQLARITKAGGLNVHNIDCTDHRRYGSNRHPLEFLREESSEEIVYQSNRLRLFQFRELFECHGFEIVAEQVYNSIPIDDALRNSFAEPFRRMLPEQLSPLQARLIARRR